MGPRQRKRLVFPSKYASFIKSATVNTNIYYMSITKKTKIIYTCQDGMEFDNEFDAWDHELFLRTRGLVQSVGGLPGSSDSITASRMARALLNNADTFSKDWGSIKQSLTRLNRVSTVED